MWAYTNGCPCSTDLRQYYTSEAAARRGDLQMLKRLHDIGFELNASTIEAAVKYAHDVVVALLTTYIHTYIGVPSHTSGRDRRDDQHHLCFDG
jgi:hypothetical protein